MARTNTWTRLWNARYWRQKLDSRWQAKSGWSWFSAFLALLLMRMNTITGTASSTIPAKLLTAAHIVSPPWPEEEFDMCLRHCILIDKIRRYWVSGNTTNVYISYLNDRRSTTIATTNIPATITTTASTITTTASVRSCRYCLELLLWQDPLTFVCWLCCFRDLCARS